MLLEHPQGWGNAKTARHTYVQVPVEVIVEKVVEVEEVEFLLVPVEKVVEVVVERIVEVRMPLCIACPMLHAPRCFTVHVSHVGFSLPGGGGQ